MNRLTSEDIQRLAEKRARAKLGWYSHAAVYVVVNGFLLVSYSMGMRSHPWSMAPMLGWGLGLALHGVAVFVIGRGGSLHDDLVRRERERIERQQGGGT